MGRLFNTGEVFMCKEAGEYILETFHFGRKISYIPPSSNTSPKVHVCIQKAQTSIWAQLLGNLLDFDGAVFNGPFSGCLQ